MYCGNCGKKLPDNASFCSECGAQMQQEVVEENVVEAVNSDKVGRVNSGRMGIVLFASVVGIVVLLVGSLFLFKGDGNKAKSVNLVQKEGPFYLIHGINDPEVPDATNSEWSNGKGSYIYFGNYYQDDSVNKKPIKWRVLDFDTYDFSNNSTIFLMSDKILDQVEFNREEDYLGYNAAEWKQSNLSFWLNSSYLMASQSIASGKYTSGGFYNTAFYEVEKGAIASSTKKAKDQTYYNGYYKDNSGLESIKIFVLSVEEADNNLYGFYHGNVSPASRSLECTDYAIEQGVQGSISYSWWLRSKYESYELCPVYINNGKFNYDMGFYSAETGVAPAMNIEMEAIAFTTNFDYIKDDFDVVDAAKKSNEWKLTLYGGSGFKARLEDDDTVKKGKEICVEIRELGKPQMGVEYTQISAMLVAEDGEVVCYGCVDEDVTVDEVEIEIPKDKSVKKGKYELLVFAEQVNSDNPDQCTDYISNMVSLEIEVK